MEQTSKIIGANIAAFRKAKGLTQEQLAARLGVSAPAVSKWETGSTCPDVTLLCPLARALDTHVDTLLQFEQTLSEQQIAEEMNEILKTAMAQDLAVAEARLTELLRQYPGCTALQYKAVTAYDIFRMFVPDVDEKTQTRWQQSKRTLLEEVRANGKALYWQEAAVQLASMAIADGKLEEGEKLLKELPETVSDPTSIWSLYYLKKNEPEEALKRTQKQLYKLVVQTQTCLALLMNPQLQPKPEQLYKVSCAYRAVARTFGMMDLSDGALMEAYLEMGKTEKAVACFARYVDAALGPAVYPDEALFTPGLTYQKQENVQATTAAMRRMILKSVTEEERYRPLFSYQAFTKALERLKANV